MGENQKGASVVLAFNLRNSRSVVLASGCVLVVSEGEFEVALLAFKMP